MVSHKKTHIKDYIFSSTNHIWKSRLSWKIAANVFFTILIVQGALLYFSLKDFEESRLIQLENIAKAAIVPMLDNDGSQILKSPIDQREAQLLLSSKSKLTGFTVYSSQFDYIANYGEPMTLSVLNLNSLGKTYRSPDGSSYETIFRSSDLGWPYIISVRLNSTSVQIGLVSFFVDNLIVIGLLSGLVTVVLMIALGYLLLEPIIFLSRALSSAAQDPENPDIQASPFDSSDEMGRAVEMTQDLIQENAKNLTQVKSQAQDQIHQLAYFDTLTGLPNRTRFKEVLAKYIAGSGEKDTQRFAVMAIDLDHFKDINDSMGHNVGDAILKGVGQRFRAMLPDDVVVSRSGEDEFGILMPINDVNTNPFDLGEQVLSILRDKSFEVFNEQFQVRGSLGVAVFPDNGITPELVMKNADIALNRAKEDGRDAIKTYSEDFDKAVQQRFQMLRDLSEALDKDEIQLFYQPQFDLKTGAIIGAEGLLRWWKPNNSKEGGAFISPGEFIPVAEQSGLIVPIGEQVIEHACYTAKRINDTYSKNLRIAVNVSGVQFTQSNLPEVVTRVLSETGLNPQNLELEVTESIFMKDIKQTIETLKVLHEVGVELAIDDFGTGYSSLSYLRQFPIDRLKIDQSFIRNALNNADDAAITRTIIGLGHSLNLSVIAEGVETRDHEQFLMDQNCDEVQGFRYCKPIPADQFEAFVANYNGDLSSFDV